jgi:hypothetical protein
MRKLRLWALLALALAFMATTASPAAAHSGHGKKPKASSIGYCDALKSSTFSSLRTLSSSSATTARSVDRFNHAPDRSGIADSSEIPSGSEPSTAGLGVIEVPVYFHVVHDGRTGYVSEKRVVEQITVMNLGYSGFYGGYDQGFRFVLKSIDYSDNAGWFAQDTFAQEIQMKSALKIGGETDLNIYSTSGGGYLGWAYYPSIVKYNGYEMLDGLVIHYGSMPGGYIKNYNLGHTATHEVGHWFGLAHTFADKWGCSGHGDYVADTPEEGVPTTGCPIGKDTCPTPGYDPIHNFMDYSYDSCYTQLTAGQAARGAQQYMFWRVKKGYHT